MSMLAFKKNDYICKKYCKIYMNYMAKHTGKKHVGIKIMSNVFIVEAVYTYL